jgi:hypothetical protein
VIQNTHQGQNDHLFIYYRGTRPNPMLHLVWTGAVVAFRYRIELSSQATPVGVNASHRDMAFHALVDVTELTRDIMNTTLSNSVTIYYTWLTTRSSHGV